MHYTLAVAGSTSNTLACLQALLKSAGNQTFSVEWVLTPVAKPVGRKKIITPNPIEKFALDNSIPVVNVDQKIDTACKDQIDEQKKPDFLLVVDFGYIVPNWLISLPIITTLNIHPSELPKWRGSSPAQFAILFGEKKSAITLLHMNAKLDQGPIVHQEFFSVQPHWTSFEYYQHAFSQMCGVLAETIGNLGSKNSIAHEQPLASPTITARSISKEDSFIPWHLIQQALRGQKGTQVNELPKLLQFAYAKHGSLAKTIFHATQAFQPWPVVWTVVPTSQGKKRMKLFLVSYQDDKLELLTVQVEGKNKTTWNEIKNLVV